MNEPQRWTEILGRLQSLMETLVCSLKVRPLFFEPGTSLEEMVRLMFVDEALCREEANSLAVRLASGSSLPREVGQESVYFLIQRCECACDFLGQVFPPKAERSPFAAIAGTWSDADLMRWLLVDLWRRKFDHWMKLQAMAMAMDLPLYGLLDADPDAEE